MNQSTAVIKQDRVSALNAMAQRFSVEPAKLCETLKATVFKGASNEQLMSLVIVANEYNLNPFKKEIYAFPGKGGEIIPIVGIDGWINIMNSHPQFDGVEFDIEHDAGGKLVSCTASIYRKDRSRPVKVKELLAECKRNTDPWNTMPSRMLRNRALAQCVRIAFTAGGIVDEEEAAAGYLDPVAHAKPIQATVEPEPPAADTRKPKEKAEPRSAKSQPSKKDLVGAWMTENQLTWSQVQPILAENDVIENADSIASFDEVTEDQATAIFGARTGLEAALGKGEWKK